MSTTTRTASTRARFELWGEDGFINCYTSLRDARAAADRRCQDGEQVYVYDVTQRDEHDNPAIAYDPCAD